MNKKRILSALLTLCLVVGMVLGAQMSVSAATTTGIKITFNGKSITLGTASEPKTLAAVEKKWGKKTRLAKKGEEYAGYAYVWEKGKSKIFIMQGLTSDSEGNLTAGDSLGYACVESTDSNVAVAGVKVGMKRATALKKLRNTYGKKNVTLLKKGQNGYTANTILVNAENGMPIEYTLKSGKVSSIFWMRS